MILMQTDSSHEKGQTIVACIQIVQLVVQLDARWWYVDIIAIILLDCVPLSTLLAVSIRVFVLPNWTFRSAVVSLNGKTVGIKLSEIFKLMSRFSS